MTKTVPNPALDKLHHYYQPAPPLWTPQTIGWYVLFVIIALLLFWFAVHVIRAWVRNRYRREALSELTTATPDQFSTLLKRTALAAWPREKIASLSGDAWIDFLNSSAKNDLFHGLLGERIEEIALHQNIVSQEDEHTLRALTAEWIRSHRVQA